MVLPLGAVPGFAGQGPAGGGGSPVSEPSPSELVGAGSLVSTGGSLVSVEAVGVTGGDVGVTSVGGVTGVTGGVTGVGPEVEGGVGGVTDVDDGLPLGVTGGVTGTGETGDGGVTPEVVVVAVGPSVGAFASVSPQPAATTNTKQDATTVERERLNEETKRPETTDDKRMSPVLAQATRN